MAAAGGLSPAVRTAIASITALFATGAGLLVASADRSQAAFPAAHAGEIAYSAGANGVFEISPKGENPTNVTATLPGPIKKDPAFSQDGRRLAVAAGPSANTDIWVVNANGSGGTDLTAGGPEDTQPSFSPDGKRIAFTRSLGGNLDVFAMNANGSGVVDLTPTDPADDSTPSYSPDGRRIAFTRRVGGNDRVFTMGAGGSSPVDLTPRQLDRQLAARLFAERHPNRLHPSQRG